ncbi:MAG: 4a-hydroxytetrahydrobiopterin dehydratase [Caldilineaceae bacterium SB0665_bin_25]|nr:4a-hydroxytetrahydrobiopterin dehydratase [Caldilineaceae bacterium SB0665_bin_25]
MQPLLYNMPTLFAALGIRLKQISRIRQETDDSKPHVVELQQVTAVQVLVKAGQHIRGEPVEDRINSEEVRRLLDEFVPEWEVREERLYRRFETANWRVTLMTANAIGFLSEAAYHHPRLVLNYRSVEVYLTTHDAGGLTKLDFSLARKIEETVGWPRSREEMPGRRPKEWLRS